MMQGDDAIQSRWRVVPSLAIGEVRADECGDIANGVGDEVDRDHLPDDPVAFGREMSAIAILDPDGHRLRCRRTAAFILAVSFLLSLLLQGAAELVSTSFHAGADGKGDGRFHDDFSCFLWGGMSFRS